MDEITQAMENFDANADQVKHQLWMDLNAIEEKHAALRAELVERESYLELVIEAFMIQYCPDGEGVAEWAIAEARAKREGAE